MLKIIFQDIKKKKTYIFLLRIFVIPFFSKLKKKYNKLAYLNLNCKYMLTSLNKQNTKDYSHSTIEEKKHLLYVILKPL